jgi:hypothetical protein
MILGSKETREEKFNFFLKKQNLGLAGERVGCGWCMDVWWSMQRMTRMN